MRVDLPVNGRSRRVDLDPRTSPLLLGLSRVALRAIKELPNGLLRIGAQVANSDLIASTLVRGRYPLLCDALMAGVPANVRGKPPLVVNLDPPDVIVAMTAFGAEIEVLSPDRSKRRIPIDALHRSSADASQRETVLQRGEIITAVMLPAPPAGHQRYGAVRGAGPGERALASVAVIIALTAGRIDVARIACGCASHRPWRSRQAEEVLLGQPAAARSYERAAQVATGGAVGRAHSAVEIDVLRRALCRTLADCVPPPSTSTMAS
jgi:xanthine dehydrogenase YagS FAD-binding subunit